jgi:hypothetical protein
MREHEDGGGEHALVVEGAVTMEVPRGADRGDRDAGVPLAGGERVYDGGEASAFKAAARSVSGQFSRRAGTVRDGGEASAFMTAARSVSSRFSRRRVRGRVL